MAITPGDGNRNAHRNRRTWIENRSRQCFPLQLSPYGRQMSIENTVSNTFDLRSSIVLTFSIAALPVWLCIHKNGTKTIRMQTFN